jgi:hypothetical protein
MVIPWSSVRQALVRNLRANLVLSASLPGDWAEGAAPMTTEYPLGVYALVPSPGFYDWTGVVWDMLVDVFIFSRDQGEAASLDQLAFMTLQDARLDFDVDQLTSVSCRRTGVLSLQDTDERGNTIYQVGGTFRIRVAQSTPTLSTLVVTADSDIA